MRKIGFLFFVMIVFGACDNPNCTDNIIKERLNYYYQLKSNGDSSRIYTIDSLVYECNYKTPDLFVDKASYYYSTKNWQLAIEAYSNALELGYDKELIYNNRALCYSSSNRSGLAWEDYNSFVRYNTGGEMRAKILKLGIYSNLKQEEKALEVINDIIEENPESPFFQFDKGNLLLNLGDTLGYCEAMNKAIELGIEKAINKDKIQLQLICN